MSALSQTKQLPDWAKGAILGAVIYLACFIFYQIWMAIYYSDIALNDLIEILLICLLFGSTYFWRDVFGLIFQYIFWEKAWIMQPYNFQTRGVELIFALALSLVMWSLSGALLGKLLKFHLGRKVFLVVIIFAFSINFLMYAFIALGGGID